MRTENIRPRLHGRRTGTDKTRRRPDAPALRDDRNDSLLLRTQSKPLDDGMLHTEEFERLVAGMLATVRDPANEA